MVPPARSRYVGPAVLIAVLAGISLFVACYLRWPRPGPLGLKVHDQNDLPLATLELTNRTRYGYSYAFWTEVLSNGVWIDASTQPPKARRIDGLLPHCQLTLEVPLPPKGTTWRIHLKSARNVGRHEALLAYAFMRLKLRYPFDQVRHSYSDTNVVPATP